MGEWAVRAGAADLGSALRFLRDAGRVFDGPGRYNCMEAQHYARRCQGLRGAAWLRHRSRRSKERERAIVLGRREAGCQIERLWLLDRQSATTRPPAWGLAALEL